MPGRVLLFGDLPYIVYGLLTVSVLLQAFLGLDKHSAYFLIFLAAGLFNQIVNGIAHARILFAIDPGFYPLGVRLCQTNTLFRHS